MPSAPCAVWEKALRSLNKRRSRFFPAFPSLAFSKHIIYRFDGYLTTFTLSLHPFGGTCWRCCRLVWGQLPRHSGPDHSQEVMGMAHYASSYRK